MDKEELNEYLPKPFFKIKSGNGWMAGHENNKFPEMLAGPFTRADEMTYCFADTNQGKSV